MPWIRELRRSRHRPTELGWAAFCLTCAVGMLLLPQWQTVPFHWIWLTITLLYGYRRWSNTQTALTLMAVAALTTFAMLRTPIERAELSEVPLMACVFLAMVWHVRRHQDAVDDQRRTGAREREFMRDAAHSLRTPLTVAQGHAELLLDRLNPGTQDHDDATVMLDELRRLSRISDQLLLLSAAGHADALLLAPVRLDKLAREAARRWSAAGQREITVEDPTPVLVLGDEQRLRHALDALVENALNATGPGDRVAISANVRDDRARLTVADTGPGIPPADADRVFERFVRTSCGGGRTGTGLGLAIVKAITEAHGGAVTLTSRPGSGASFTMTLGPGLAVRPKQADFTAR